MRIIFCIVVIGFATALNFLEDPYILYDMPHVRSPHTFVTDAGQITLHSGYISHAAVYSKKECYNYVVERGIGQSKINFESQTTNEELIDKLDIKVSANGGAQALINLDAEFTFAKAIQSNSLTISFKYASLFSRDVNLKLDSNLPQEEQLTNAAKSILKKNKADFSSLCGDHLIESYEEGAMLIASLDIVFSNVKDKMSIEPKLKELKVKDYVNISGEVAKILEKNKINSRITFNAFQVGGTPNSLTNIIDSSILDCSTTNLEACKKAQITILNYAKEDFKKQITDEDGQGKNFVPLFKYKQSESSVKDSDISLDIDIVEPSAGTELRRQYLSNLALELVKIRDGLTKIVEYYPNKQDSKFQDALNKTRLIITTLKSKMAVNCYYFPSKCLDLYNTIRKAAEKNIEFINNILQERLKEMETSVHLYFILKDDLCIEAGSRWEKDTEIPIVIQKSFDRSGHYLVMNNKKASVTSGTSVNNISFFQTENKQLYQYWKIEVKESENSFEGTITCKNNSNKSSTILIKGVRLQSDFYFSYDSESFALPEVTDE